MLLLRSQYHICCCILCGYLWVYVLSQGLEWTTGQVLLDGVSNQNLPLLSRGEQFNAISRLRESIFPGLVHDFVTCKDLKGVGSFDTTCRLKSNLYSDSDIYVLGTGNLEILPSVEIVCLIEGCTISFNLSGNVKIGQSAAVVAGTVAFGASSLTMEPYSFLNTSSLGGSPPAQTSGTPVGNDGAGGGHGGRGASCLKANHTNFWGGDVYSWTTLSEPWAYGSKGGGTSVSHKFGGNGGGRVLLDIKDVLYLNGSVSAEGGDGGSLGGGGSGGSIIIRSQKL